MNFIPEQNDREVSLAEGLNLLRLNKVSKLYSDGLESDEYICFETNKGFCYEDGAIIGGSFNSALHTLISLKWVLYYKFYIKQLN